MTADFRAAGNKFVRYVADRIRESGSGAGPYSEVVHPDLPRGRFFIGRLSPGGEPAEDAIENAEDFFARLSPNSMQMRFLIDGTADTRITVRPSFLVFVRIFPAFDKVKKFLGPSFTKGSSEEDLMPAFRRVRPEIAPVELRLGDLGEEKKTYVLTWDKGPAEKLPDVYRGNAQHRIRAAHLQSEDAYSEFVRGLRGDPAIPVLRVTLRATSTPSENGLREIALALVNESQDTNIASKAQIYEETIFDVGFDASVQGGTVRPYIFPSLPKSYRFDRRMLGSGVNCNITAEPKGSDSPTRLATRAMPVYEQRRFDHRSFEGIPTDFAAVGGPDGAQILGRILAEMRKFDNEEWGRRGDELEKSLPQGALEFEEFKEDRESFREEIARFERGIKCLSHPQAKRAFELMNRTFALLGKSQNRERWRLFQVVFIVSMLPSIVGRQYPEYASADEWDHTDVIWFPTGGGKTEAYLGLTVFAMFFDRLRGRERGVTALYRFPLRLLTLQQFQRIVRAVAAANRIKEEGKIGGEQFTVGHWIGAQGSPNEIIEEKLAQVEEDAKTRKWLKIFECPNPGCGDRGIHLKFDRQLWTLQHVCPKCGVLPVFIVDHELYRYLPSIVVGTVDKLAVFGLQRRFANLIGWTGGYCQDHGFAPENECLVPHCKRKKKLVAKPIVDPVPSLHVQDELHLLKEDLGAFDSHYQTAIIGIQRKVPGSKHPWKTIAATATIEEFRRHVEHLYLTCGRRFPTPGPYYEKTFFAQTDPTELSRLFVGIIPHGLTHINAMIEILWYFHREISTLREMSPADFLDRTGLKGALDPADIRRFLDQYEISLTYVLTKKSGDQMAESLDAQIRDYLTRHGLKELITEILSGGTTSDKITEVMDRIENHDSGEPDYSKHIRSVVATSMISHGVDVERFNFIPFFGMPRMTSEYIQASSRVGRALPGIALVCFAPARERDRSHYHLFGKYHEYLERLVEPAAINRWSKFSVSKTITGIIVGHVINRMAREVGVKLTTESAISAYTPKTLNGAVLNDAVSEYYGAARQMSGEFAATISTMSDKFCRGLRPNAKKWIGNRKGWKPMRSLRDIDKEVKFAPTVFSAELFEMLLKDRLAGGEVDSGEPAEGKDE